MAARASTGRGTKAVYDSEGIDPCNAQHITASVFINDDESGLHHDYEVWLEKLAPHAPIDQYWHNRTGEACPEGIEGTTPTRI